MIEALVDHAKQRGFEVFVWPGRLSFRKVIDGQLWGYDWAIMREELNCAPKEVLIDDLDYRLNWVDKAAQSHA